MATLNPASGETYVIHVVDVVVVEVDGGTLIVVHSWWSLMLTKCLSFESAYGKSKIVVHLIAPGIVISLAFAFANARGVGHNDRYTKRTLLAGVYATTELYMLTDYSPGFSDTWQQIDRRLEDIITLGKASQQVSHTEAFAA